MIPGSQSHVTRHHRAFAKFFRTQRDESRTRVDPDEWNGPLAKIIVRQAEITVVAFADEVSRRFGGRFDPAYVENYLAEYARITAEATNATTASELAAASGAEAIDTVWSAAIGVRAVQMAVSKTTTEGNLGRIEAAKQAGAGTKRWVVTSNRPRSSHAAVSGQSVQIGDVFSNGAKFPGDPALTVDERVGCSCLLDF